MFIAKIKRQRRRPKKQRRRRNQRGKGFLANYLGSELRDVGGQVARTVVLEGVNEAQGLLRKGARFLKNKLMRRRNRTTAQVVPTFTPTASTVPAWED